MLDRAREEYRRLTRLPFNDWERHYNQSYMCFLRDFIAEQEGRDPETVQTEYEEASRPWLPVYAVRDR